MTSIIPFFLKLYRRLREVGKEKRAKRKTKDSRPTLRCFSSLRQGQRDRKGGPSAHRTLYGHLSVMRSHHLLHDIQSQPCSSRFRGMQWLKNLGILLWGNTDTGITDVEGHRRSLLSPTQC